MLPSLWVFEEILGVGSPCKLVLAEIQGVASWCLQQIHEVGVFGKLIRGLGKTRELVLPASGC